MYRPVILCVFLYYLKGSHQADVLRTKRQTEVETIIKANIPPALLNFGTLRDIAERLVTRGQDQSGHPYDVTIEYAPNGQQNQGFNEPGMRGFEHFRRPPSEFRGPPPGHFRKPPSEFRGPPPEDFRGPPSEFRGPPPEHFQRPPSEFRGPPPEDFRGPPSEFRGPPPEHFQRPPSEFRGPPPEHFRRPPSEFRGPPPKFEGPPRRFKDRRPGWFLPSDIPGYEVIAAFSFAPPPGQFRPYNRRNHHPHHHHRNGENDRENQNQENESHEDNNSQDKNIISGYLDGDFPVILLDRENEVRR